ncbi:uncharacterized protein TNCV_1861061 [Trichonephila clavipes]|nr:uncharacterized protein TNCV_1861061 [Trichonephila clavipes]
MLCDKCKWPWGHCLLFDLGQAPTPRLAVIDNRRSLSKKNPAATAGTLVRNVRCSRRRRIDEADISTPVAVDLRAVNCMEEAVRSFTAMRSRRRSSRADVTFRRTLPVFQIVWCSLVHCFQTRIIVELFRCTRASIAR